MRISFGMFYVFRRNSTGLKFGVCDMLIHFVGTVCFQDLNHVYQSESALSVFVLLCVIFLCCVRVCVCAPMVCPKLPVQKIECVLASSKAPAVLLPLMAAIIYNLMGNG